MRTRTGLDVLIANSFNPLRGKSVGIVCNQASVSHCYVHAIDWLLPLHQKGDLRLKAVFGPQHGLFGHTQDNMIEWEPNGQSRFPFVVHSLYGEHREPTSTMLEDIELLVIDLQDVGARYYTFIWTMALCLKVCEELGIEVLVLDRPNPLGGLQVEGNVSEPEFASFVGLYPMPIRHGWTIAEIATYLRSAYFPKVQVRTILMDGWNRSNYGDESETPWAVPSPNMPTVDTAVVYPGGCLIEATNLSEGRGTTRPFEIIGAPFLDGWKFAAELNSRSLPGVHFRPLQFEPTFNKHAKSLCEGTFVHVTDRSSFRPVLTYVAIMQQARRQAGDAFSWNPPPYEYEFHRLPIDILAGNSWIRQSVDELVDLSQIEDRFASECLQFDETRRGSLLY